jgi:hypothetical protein
MGSWVDGATPQDGDLLLQMDIEGYEYEVIFNAPAELLSRFRIMVCEFHWLEMMWSKPFLRILSRAFDKIHQTHTCVHIHPNNFRAGMKHRGIDIPSLLEFTFLRNDRVKSPRPATSFPHPLDCDNTRNTAMPLPSCWYNGI